MASRPKSFSPPEERDADGLLDGLLGLQRGLPHVARHESGAVHLHQLALFQHADGGVQAGDDAGHGGLAGAGVAHEDHVQAHGGHGQVVCLAQLAHLHEVDQVLDVLLDVLQTHQLLELAHELVKVGLFGLHVLRTLGGLLAAGGLGLQLVLLHEAGLGARDKVQGVEALLALAHAGGVADGGELVGTLGDEGGLLVGHVVIHRGQIQQDVGQHPDEGAGGLGAAPGVALGQVPVEHRGQEHLALADGAGQTPEHPAGLGLAAGVELVGHVHMALGDAAGLAPQAQGALGHKLVQLLGEPRPAQAVKGIGVGGIDLMELLGRSGPGSRHVRASPSVCVQ